jgi:hypothetical protein
MRNRIMAFAILLIAFTTPSFAGLNRWTSSGPEGAFITSLAADSVVYAGTTGAGVFRSTTNDPEWTPFNTGLSDLMITALAVDRDVVYAGTASGRLFRSVNDGPWTEAAKPAGGVVYEFAVDRQRNTVYAATGVVGLLRSRDRGKTWEVVPGLAQWATDVILTGDGTLYAVVGSLLQVSLDGGVTWGGAGDGSRWSIAADAESTIYTIEGGGGRVVFSTDYGKTWRPTPPLAPYANNVFPRSGGVYATTPEGLYAFDVAGVAWTRISGSLPMQVNALTFLGTQLFAGTSGGVWTGTAENPEWRRANRGLNIAPVFDVASSGTSTAYAATNAGLYKTSDGTQWRNVLNEPVKEVETDGAALIKVSGDGVRSSADGGETWERVTTRITPALAITNSTPATLYAAFDAGIAKSTDGGRVWQSISSGLDYPYGWWFYGLDVIVAETDDSNAARAYVAWEAGLFKTDNSGEHWDRIIGVANQYNEIPAVAARGEIIHASRGTGITTSVDGGGSWAPAQVADQRFRAIIIDKTDPARSYAGSDGGRVYRSEDFGRSWELFGEGLGSAPINRLDINDAGDRIYAATSAGLFEYRIGASIPIERLPDDPLRLPGLIRGLLAGVRATNGAEAAAAGSSAAFVLPAVGTVRGFRGTTFRTDVTLSNDRAAVQNLILAWLPQGNLSAASVPMYRLTLPASSGDAGGTLNVSDLADELQLDGLGSIIVFATDANGNSDSAASIYGFARVRSAAACGSGSVSQAVSAVSSQTFATHQRGRALGLRHDSANRTNVGIVNLDESPRAFTVVVSGVRTTERFTIVVPAFAPLQVPVPDRDYGAVTLTILNSGNGPWAAYGSSVDNNSSDGWTSGVLPLP